MGLGKIMIELFEVGENYVYFKKFLYLEREIRATVF